MILNFEYSSSEKIKTDGVLIFVSSDDLKTCSSNQYLSADISTSIELGINSELFFGDYNEQKTFAISSTQPRIVHLSGLGKLKDMTPEKLRRIETPSSMI